MCNIQLNGHCFVLQWKKTGSIKYFKCMYDLEVCCTVRFLTAIFCTVIYFWQINVYIVAWI